MVSGIKKTRTLCWVNLKADENLAYFMGVIAALMLWQKISLKIVKFYFSGDAYLINTYSALKQPDDDSVENKKAKEFIEFAASNKGSRYHKKLRQRKLWRSTL